MKGFPVPELILSAIFVLCLLTTLAGGLLAVSTHRIIRSVCGLALCCVGLAGLYYFLHSPFLALMEILIYVGAVCVTIVFAVMLAEPEEPAAEKRSKGLVWGMVTAVICAAIFWGLWKVGSVVDWTAPVRNPGSGSLRAIGISLLTTYSLAFELISLALLVAILGALAIARGGRDKA